MSLTKKELDLLEKAEKVLKIEHYDKLAKQIRNLRYKHNNSKNVINYIKSKEANK